MSTEITVTLPDDVWQQAEMLAQRAGRPVADVLAETIELSLRPLGRAPAAQDITACSDDEVVALAGAELDPPDDERLSHLLAQQQAGLLTPAERADLLALMQVYQDRLLRKAEALHEAVRRGLMEPLES